MGKGASRRSDGEETLLDVVGASEVCVGEASVVRDVFIDPVGESKVFEVFDGLFGGLFNFGEDEPLVGVGEDVDGPEEPLDGDGEASFLDDAIVAEGIEHVAGILGRNVVLEFQPAPAVGRTLDGKFGGLVGVVGMVVGRVVEADADGGVVAHVEVTLVNCDGGPGELAPAIVGDEKFAFGFSTHLDQLPCRVDRSSFAIRSMISSSLTSKTGPSRFYSIW